MLREIPVLRYELPNGETLAYRKVGNGEQKVLLIHGNMSSSIHYDVVMEALEEKYSVYAVDMRGFGDSTYNRPINSLRDFATDMEMFAIGLNLNDLVVMGWSTGGGVALEMAADCPELVKKVILVESVGVKGYPMFKKNEQGQPILSERISSREDIAKDPVQVVPALLAQQAKNKEYFRTIWNLLMYNRNQPASDRYERYLEAMLQQRNLVDVDYALVHFNMTNEHNGVAEGSNRLELIQSDVLIIQGEKDMVVPMQFALETQKHLGDKAKLVLLKESGHSPITDEFDEFIKIVNEFIKI